MRFKWQPHCSPRILGLKQGALWCHILQYAASKRINSNVMLNMTICCSLDEARSRGARGMRSFYSFNIGVRPQQFRKPSLITIFFQHTLITTCQLTRYSALMNGLPSCVVCEHQVHN